MKQEIEIKLLIEPNNIEMLQNSQFISQLKCEKQFKQLENIYFDTQEYSLQKEKIALRIRKDGDRYIQTLKTKGSSQHGLHKRLEWEWPLASDQLNIQLIPVEHWPKHIGFERLTAVFNTNFQREIWVFEHFDNSGNHAKIEMALDQGVIGTQNSVKTLAISELELELISGEAVVLEAVVKLLMQECPSLTPSDLSKAQRGLILLKSL